MLEMRCWAFRRRRVLHRSKWPSASGSSHGEVGGATCAGCHGSDAIGTLRVARFRARQKVLHAAAEGQGEEPKDQAEAMLAARMAADHNATMTFARRLAHVDNIPQQDSAERAFNKLARTFASQVEALKRYRSGGEQTSEL
jgi:hypothetical protein